MKMIMSFALMLLSFSAFSVESQFSDKIVHSDGSASFLNPTVTVGGDQYPLGNNPMEVHDRYCVLNGFRKEMESTREYIMNLKALSNPIQTAILPLYGNSYISTRYSPITKLTCYDWETYQPQRSVESIELVSEDEVKLVRPRVLLSDIELSFTVSQGYKKVCQYFGFKDNEGSEVSEDITIASVYVYGNMELAPANPAFNRFEARKTLDSLTCELHDFQKGHPDEDDGLFKGNLHVKDGEVPHTIEAYLNFLNISVTK